MHAYKYTFSPRRSAFRAVLRLSTMPSHHKSEESEESEESEAREASAEESSGEDGEAGEARVASQPCRPSSTTAMQGTPSLAWSLHSADPPLRQLLVPTATQSPAELRQGLCDALLELPGRVKDEGEGVGCRV